MSSAKNESKSDVEDIDYLEAVRQNSDSRRGATTKEVAEEFGYTREGARKRLVRLRKKGLVESNKYSGTYAWYLSEDGESKVGTGEGGSEGE